MISKNTQHLATGVEKESNMDLYIRLFFYLAVIFLLSLSMGMNAILFPVTMEGFKFTESSIGFVLAGETAAALIVCLALQWIFNRLGIAVAIIFALIFRLFSLAELSSSNTAMEWGAFVFLHGIGAYLTVIMLQTLITALPFTRHKTIVNACFGVSISLGYTLGPLLIELLNNDQIQGHFFLRYFDDFIDYIEPSALLSWLISASAGIILLMSLGLRKTALITSNNEKLNLFRVIASSPGVYGAVASAGVAIYGIMAFITIYGLRNNMDLYHASLLLSAFMLGCIVLEPLYAWISVNFDLRYFLFANTFVALTFSAFLSIAIYDFKQVAIILFLWGGSNASTYSVALTILGKKFKDNELVAANAAFSLMDNIGGTLSVIIIGVAMQYIGSEGFSYVIIGASILYFSFGLTRYKVI